MKCIVCGKDAYGKFCDICNPNLDVYNDDEDYSIKKKSKKIDLRRKRARQRKEEEWD